MPEYDKGNMNDITAIVADGDCLKVTSELKEGARVNFVSSGFHIDTNT